VKIDSDWEKRRVGKLEGLEGIDRRTFVKMSGLSAVAKKGGWGMSRSVLPLASMILAVLLSCLAVVAQSAEGQPTRHAGHLGGNPPPWNPQVPRGFTFDQVADIGSAGTDMEIVAPSGKLFAADQAGYVQLVDPASGNQRRVLDITTLTPDDTKGERGLHSILSHPDFNKNGWLYVAYTHRTMDGVEVHNRISRFTWNVQSHDFPLSSELLIREYPSLAEEGANHYGFGMTFASGKLYVFTGDHSKPAIPPPDAAKRAQDLNSQYGKILGYNPDGSIPTDNPYYQTQEGDAKAIWARGLRNPTHADFQPSTGTLWFTDTGNRPLSDSVAYEEVNAAAWKANYGWPIYSGPAADPSYQDPTVWYAHPKDSLPGAPLSGCAVTGGSFYEGSIDKGYPERFHNYFFITDVGCQRHSWIAAIDPDTRSVERVADGLVWTVDLEFDRHGRLYALSHTGQISRIYHGKKDDDKDDDEDNDKDHSKAHH
jgi:glucose/arabinose dehydrogenase